MQSVEIAGLERPVSCLGMGCASLGSRISAKEGLKALEAAYDGGVRWFDVAPAYGAGQAEDILGQFLTAHGAEAQICSKVGLAPPKQSPLKRAVLAAGRQVSRHLKPLAAKLRGTKMLKNTRVPLTPELLTSSIERSLTRLGREQLDVYALHNAAAGDLSKDEILRTLEGIIQGGKAKLIAVASDYDAAYAALEGDGPISVVQIALGLEGEAQDIIAKANAKGKTVITHSVFGVSGNLQALSDRLAARPDLKSQLGGTGSLKSQLADMLLTRALALNPKGVTLASMYSEASLTQNLKIANAPGPKEVPALVSDLLGTPV